ncbi:MAG: carboxymuconolactone decarboxylase family protein [Chlamydiia bacterium]|nr:carboxymuconolactone decarboxylase family protein [Chlamydiia bacterium]
MSPYPWYIRLLIWNQKRRYGKPLEPTLYWGRLGSAALYFMLLFRALKRAKTQVPESLQTLVQTLVSKINRCSFCTDLNSELAKCAGNDEDKIAKLLQYKDSELFTQSEKAVLAYAEAVTLNQKADLKGLREIYDEQTIIQLTALIAFQNMSSKFNTALGLA